MLAAVLGLGFVLTVGFVAVLFFALPAAKSEDIVAVFTWIPGPTNTPQPPTSTALPTSTITPEFTPLASGELGVGSYVQIFGTGGVGLNIRNAPGLSGDIQFLAYDAEVFVVQDGPRDADGKTWWYLVTPVDQSRAGWAAADYLEVVANP